MERSLRSTWTTLILAGKSARIKTEKSRGELPYREIFWSNETNEQLKKWVVVREKFIATMELEEPKAVFFGIKAGSGASNYSAKGKRLQVNYVSELFRKYSNRANLPIINPHSFRHLFRTRSGKEEGEQLCHFKHDGSCQGRELVSVYDAFRKGSGGGVSEFERGIVVF